MSTPTLTLHTGNEIPVIGLGTWQLTVDTAQTIDFALKAGYPMIDTSSDYGTQPGIAKGIKMSMHARDLFYITTKVEETDDAYERVQSNLQELQLSYVDLMLIHRPPEDGPGYDLWDGLIRAKKEGLVKDIGVSNYRMEQIEQLYEKSGEMPVVNQIEWSPFGYSDDMYEFCREHYIIIQAYSPLTRGERLDHGGLAEIARGYDKTPAQILIRWNLQKEVIPLPKANHEEHLLENIDVFDFELSADDMRRLDSLNEHYSALGTLAYV